MFKLNNQIKHYEWGSPDYIPRLMGIAGDGSPWAELWMGSHSGAPSRVCLPTEEINLGELIARDPYHYLGKDVAERYDALPFLFKLLAAEKPLSIQAHPNLAQAREGFDRENRAGLAQDAPNRNYRDSNHKPEIVCAITPFTGMCGFRTPDEIRKLLTAFLELPGSPSTQAVIRKGFIPLLQAFNTPDPASALRNFLNTLFGLSPAVREALTEYILSPIPIEWELMQNFARLYPGDPAVIAPLYLNVFRLEPGEAVFLKAGVLHAYCHGFAVELMANSDNVLRGGLTSKHIDVPELMKVLDFSPLEPQIIKPGQDFSCFTYPAPCEEFSLMVMRGSGAETAFVPDSPSICIVTEGEVSVRSSNDDMSGCTIKQGESAFIPPAANSEALILQGHYTLYTASVGRSHPDQ